MKFFIHGQNLKVAQRIIASGTARILTADFRFSPEWDGMRKYAHFEQNDKKYPVLIENDKITADKNLNLGQGVWEVWVHGNRFDDDANFQRITTVKAKISVDPSGLCGDPLPVEPPSFGEQLDERVSALEAGGGAGGGGGTTDHSKLTNRDQPDQHPMEAITGLAELRDKINAFLDADDSTLDQLTELIAAIKANQGTIEKLTNGKVNTADIVNDLTTGGANKVLSAEMGKELKRLIDAIEPPDLAAQVEAARDAAREAGQSASNAAGSAQSASGSADTANAAAGRAEAAESGANSAAETARGHADNAAGSAQTATEQADNAVQSATTAQEQASAAAGSAATATSEADRAKREADRAEQAGGKPTKLEPLTFTGAVSETYDGTQPVSVEIPQGEGSHEIYIGAEKPPADSTAILWIYTEGNVPPPSEGVVTDGLLMRLNGENMGSDYSVWADEVNGYKFQLTNAKKVADGVQFDGKSSYADMVNPGNAVKFSDDGTIECAVTLPSSDPGPRRTWLVLCANGPDQLVIGPSSAVLPYSSTKKGGYRTTLEKEPGFHGISVSARFGYMDGVELQKDPSGDTWSAGSQIRVSGRDKGNNFPLNGIVHEIRVYNRQLSKEEILSNWKHDMIAYGGLL